MNFWGIINLKLLLDVLFAVGFGLLLFSRVKEQRTLWLLRGYLFLVSSAWFIQRYAYLPLTSKLIDAVVLACSLSSAKRTTSLVSITYRRNPLVIFTFWTFPPIFFMTSSHHSPRFSIFIALKIPFIRYILILKK